MSSPPVSVPVPPSKAPVPIDDKHSCIAVAGPSGVGKSTLIKKLMKEYPGKFGFSVSHTTRPPRPMEKEGVDYHFTTKDEFLAGIKKNLFIEHAMVHDNIYGTSVEAVDTVMNAGKICILDVDVQGIFSIEKSSLEPMAYIFVVPPDFKTLEKRLNSRGDKSDSIQIRLKTAKDELSHTEHPIWTHKIVSVDGDQPYIDFRNILVKDLGCIDPIEKS